LDASNVSRQKSSQLSSVLLAEKASICYFGVLAVPASSAILVTFVTGQNTKPKLKMLTESQRKWFDF